MPNNVLLLAFLGALGTLCRYFLDQWITKTFPSNFFLGTLVINLMGSFVIGFLFFNNQLSEFWRATFSIAFLGAFTTFSALSLQSLIILKNGNTLAAFFYFLGSPTAGLFACYLGSKLSELKLS